MPIIEDNTAEVLAEASRRIDKALHKVGPKIVKTAQSIVPVVSGDLQASITDEVEDGRLVVGSPLDYAHEVEANTPYLRPALEANMAELERALEE